MPPPALTCPYCGRVYPHATALTPRETSVLARVAEGENVKDIAAFLHISRKTVETHLQHIRAKLGLADTYALVAYAARTAGQPPAAPEPP